MGLVAGGDGAGADLPAGDHAAPEDAGREERAGRGDGSRTGQGDPGHPAIPGGKRQVPGGAGRRRPQRLQGLR